MKTIAFSIILFICQFSFGQDDFGITTINGKALKYSKLIADGSMVQDNAVGFGGVKPRQAYYFDSLKMNSTEYELVMLTNHPSGTVRCFAFRALVNLNSTEITGVLRLHENDTTIISSQSGCMVMSLSVFNFMLYEITDELLLKISFADRKYILGLRE